jgi:hypothetical protein
LPAQIFRLILILLLILAFLFGCGVSRAGPSVVDSPPGFGFLPAIARRRRKPGGGGSGFGILPGFELLFSAFRSVLFRIKFVHFGVPLMLRSGFKPAFRANCGAFTHATCCIVTLCKMLFPCPKQAKPVLQHEVFLSGYS